MGQGCALCVFDILHQATGSTEGCGGLLHAKAYQILGLKLLAEQALGGRKLELPLRASTNTLALTEQREIVKLFGIE